MASKLCRRCGREQDVAEFWRTRATRDGLQTYCKTCLRGMASSRKRQTDVPEPQVEQKRCPRCGEMKPAFGFARNRRSSDGLNPYCKPCKNEYERRRTGRPAKNPSRPDHEPDGMKWCSRCQSMKTLGEFPSSKSGRFGRHTYCRLCFVEYAREHRIAKGLPVQAKPEREVCDGEKFCCGCATIKPSAAFGRHRGRQDGLQPQCRSCMTARYQARKRAEDPGYVPRDVRLAADRAPTVLEVAWAAGFLEGEGSFVRHRDRSRNVDAVTVSAGQTDRTPLDLVRAVFGGSVGVRDMAASRKKFPNAKQTYTWSVHAARAFAVMDAIRPHVVSVYKRAQLDAAYGDGTCGRVT